MKNALVVIVLLIEFRTLAAPQATNAQPSEIAATAIHESALEAHRIDGAVITEGQRPPRLGEHTDEIRAEVDTWGDRS